MRLRVLVGNLATVFIATVSRVGERASGRSRNRAERIADLGGSASLQVRTIGKGKSVIVLHGGPDFDYGYLLPELDRFKDAYRLIYYDQRGRGKSADHVRPEDVTSRPT
jgi:proline iminopeptidase